MNVRSSSKWSFGFYYKWIWIRA